MILTIIASVLVLTPLIAYLIYHVCDKLYGRFVKKGEFYKKTIYEGFSSRPNPNYDEKKYNKYRKLEKMFLLYNSDIVLPITIALSIMTFIIWSASLLGCRCPINRDYNMMLYEKEVLEYRLSNCDEIEFTGNELLYRDITDFNNKIRTTRYYINNPWVNWFANEKIASIDYIEIIGNENE